MRLGAPTQVFPLVARVGDGLAQQAFRQHLWRLFIQPRLEGFQQRYAVLLTQPVSVVRARFSLGQIFLGGCLDLIQDLEVLERLCHSGAGLLLTLLRINEHSSGMSKATEVRDAFESTPGTVAIGHQQALVTGEERLRILLSAPWLVIEQHHRMLAVLRAAVDHIYDLLCAVLPSSLSTCTVVSSAWISDCDSSVRRSASYRRL